MRPVSSANSGWYFKDGAFSRDTHGCTMKDDLNNRVGAYRFHDEDAPTFARSLRMTLGHGEANEARADYSAVAYWYQTEPHAPWPALPLLQARLPRPAQEQPETGKRPTTAGSLLKQIQEREKKQERPGPIRLALPAVAGAFALVVLGYILRRRLRPRLPLETQNSVTPEK